MHSSQFDTHPSASERPERFRLPDGDIAEGRSQPKRRSPKRPDGPPLLRRIALGLATYLLSLGLVSMIYGVIVSTDFRTMTLENAPTAGVALLIGCFTLPLTHRLSLTPKRHLLICLTVLAFTPWTFQWGNQLDQAGYDLAPGFNFVFEILLAVALYRLAATWCARTSTTSPNTTSV